MVKIGIIGSDSSHTLGLCRTSQEFEDVKITCLYGEDKRQAQEVFEKGKFETLVENPEEMIGQVDAVMITCRDGVKHLPYAIPFLEKGIPVWIDKPFTTSIEDTEKIIALAKQYHTPVTGGSYVKLAPEVDEMKKKLSRVGEILSGLVAFPTELHSEYSGLHFYSHHLIEVMISIFGLDVRSVSAKVVNDKLVAIASYPDYPVIMNYASDYNGLIGLYGRKKTELTSIDFAKGEPRLFAEFIDMVKSRRMPYSLDFFLKAVQISNALDLSIRENREVTL